MNRFPALEPGGVQLWSASLNPPASWMERLRSWLSPVEKQRAAAFQLERHQLRFVAGRGLLRLLLAKYQGCEPSAMDFVYGEHGKPALAGTSPGLQFNLAHSGELALLAFSREQALGVDLERIKETRDLAGIAKRFFAPAECARWESLAEEKRLMGFFACWTRKEAYLKARGEGVVMGLDRFEVTVDPDCPPALLKVRGEPEAPARWRLWDLQSEPGYAACLATDGPADFSTSRWSWDQVWEP